MPTLAGPLPTHVVAAEGAEDRHVFAGSHKLAAAFASPRTNDPIA